jgi:nucleoside diphosphate kinase
MKNTNIDVEMFIIKPGVSEKLKNRIILTLENNGFNIVLNKDVRFKIDDMRKFYSKDKSDLIKIGKNVIEYAKSNGIDIRKHFPKTTPYEIGKEIMERQAKYMASGKSTILLTLREGNDTYDLAKKIVGSTYPEKAEKGTIRSWSNDTLFKATIENRAIKNLIHSSDKENLAKEFEIVSKYL